MTMCSGLIGTLFEPIKESAFAAHKMCQALSGFALFITAPYLCTQVKIFIVMSVLLVAASGYIALEVLVRLQPSEDKSTLEDTMMSRENTHDKHDEAKT